MPETQRVTLTLPADVVAEARAASGVNLSRFVAATLRRQLEYLRRLELRRALEAGYLAEADRDLEICEEFRHVDGEVGPSPAAEG